MSKNVKPFVVKTDANMDMLRHVQEELDTVARSFTTPDDSESTLIEHVPDADVLVTCYAPVTRKIIEAGGNLKGIVMWGVGYDHIDLVAAGKHGIPVVNCPNYGSQTVADHAFALLLNLARRVGELDREMRQSEWLWPHRKYMGTDVHGKTIGIIGLGKTGAAMAQRCVGFGMEILVHDPYVGKIPEDLKRAGFASLENIFDKSDFISVHCNLTCETENIIDASLLARLKPSAFIINVARGRVIEEPALIEALKNSRIAGAGLDVFSEEPLPADHPFLSMKNVLLTPHFAYFTREADIRLDKECLQAIKNILAGNPLPSLVDISNQAMPANDIFT
uniref:D-3-phosphoglycerate dehydrogenase n=1 Tax=Candidatus Kentrum sp. SD TaxID=2126332 RepID=A0A451BME5_9GAMM|nr:MAG: D-3-phosphoglycerate dehydrogenase [Candidatus Kentron sp. SD]VFK48467.1 MAG: D-3-phosphoglycerate dehydrogenase [Candidatus Kentron sp. SD]VFK79475.1 MAG: D-3-phosphoglycerate dehydrogenase [Candidatus Kentron sp. SD]